MRQILLALAFCAAFLGSALAQGGMMPGPGTVHSTGSSAPPFKWVQGQSNAFTGAGTTVDVGFTGTLGACGSFTAGDFIGMAVVATNTTTATITLPTGFTALGTQVATTTNTVKYGYKIATGSETCGSGQLTATFGASTTFAWTIFAYSAANATPLDGTPSTTTYSTAGTNTISMTGPTTSTSPTRLIAVIMGDNPPNAITASGTMTGRFSQNQEVDTTQAFLADKLVSGTGAQNETATQGTTNFFNGAYALFAIKP